jgi:tetratricopeptide (TPR) repeat protein
MMSVVRAFVGHSFTEDDKTLNSTFLDYLDQIKAMGIGFNWDHAKAAEPRELAEKVMSLIRDKNLFIGICTKKERVIGPTELERCWTKRKVLGSHESKFAWKTSDWIIQEIGLAVGREMDLILLIEEGLRPPGGLQGNIEYIEFSRGYPERSFGKILEMIRALIPKAISASVQESEIASPESAVQEEKNEEPDNWWLEPKPEWNHHMYRFALIQSIKADNLDAENKITTAFLESPEGLTPGGPANWTAYGQYLHLRAGKSGSLDKMERLAKESPEVESVHFYLGRAYEIYKEYEKAGKAYQYAAEKATGCEGRICNFGEAAKAYCRGGMKQEAEGVAARMRQEVFQFGAGEETLAAALRDVANIDSDMDVYYGLSERFLELKPADTDARFNLAYKYSQGNEEKLSLFHYLRIPEIERGGAAWNNLGVQYDHFQIVGCSVNSYRKAEQVGETLAMSNIANKFIQAGFLHEAQQICGNALIARDYHKNISHSMARIKEIPDEETKKEGELVKEAAPYSDFYKAYGRALCKDNPTNCTGIWEGPKCNLVVEIQGGRFHAEGIYELPKNLLGGLALYASLGVGIQPEPSGKRVVTYAGGLSGHTVKALVTEEPQTNESASEPKTLLTGLANRVERTVLMVVSDSFDEIRVYDKSAPESERLYSLRKLSEGK